MTILDFFKEKVTYDKMGQYLWIVQKSGNHQKLADLRGWGGIQNLFKNAKGEVDFEKAGKFQDNVGQWLVDAVNEKLEREKVNAIFKK